MKKWIFFSFLLLGLLLSYLYEFAKRHLYIVSDNYFKASYPELFVQAKLLPTFGFVLGKPNGTMKLLKVSDRYVNQLYPILTKILSDEEKHCLRPSPSKIGAHITLYGHPQPSIFLGQRYDFNIDGIFREIRIKKFLFFTQYEIWYEVAVKSQELVEAFRIDQPETLHISIGVSTRIGNTSFCVR